MQYIYNVKVRLCSKIDRTLDTVISDATTITDNVQNNVACKITNQEGAIHLSSSKFQRIKFESFKDMWAFRYLVFMYNVFYNVNKVSTFLT